jgi:hypothetical protein
MAMSTKKAGVTERAEAVAFRSYGTARDSLVRALLENAAAHEAGHFDEIGRRSDRMQLPRGGPPAIKKLRIALTFQNGWIDARDHGWKPEGKISKGEWPRIARRIASDLAKDREISNTPLAVRSRRFHVSAGGVRTALGVAYVIMLLIAATLAFLAFGPMGLLVLVPTGLWLAPGLRARVRQSGNLTDGVVGWPGLTALVCGLASLAIMALGGHAMAAAWLASVSASGVLELARATIARGDNLRAESGAPGPRRRRAGGPSF